MQQKSIYQKGQIILNLQMMVLKDFINAQKEFHHIINTFNTI